VVVDGVSLWSMDAQRLGWGVVIEQGGHCLHARSPSINGGVIVVHVVSLLSVGESISVVRIGMGGLTNGQ
jgi:hypothetical protein